jgi:hypothetical protein
MKDKFIELNVFNGNYGVAQLVNLSKVNRVSPDKNWTRIFFENKDEFLVTDNYEDVRTFILKATSE